MRLSADSLLRERNYRLVYTANLISGFGTQVTIVALPLVAVLALHASALQVGILLTCASIAVVLIGLPAGPWVDRMDRRKVMIASDLWRAVLLGSIPVAWWLDRLTMEHLYAVALIEGALTIFFDVAAQSYLPYVIGKERLVEGNSGLGAVDSVARSAGPGIAGILISLVSAPFAIIADAISYLCAALAVSLVNKPYPVVEPSGPRRNLRGEISEGLQWLWQQPILRPVTLAAAASNYFGTMSWVTLVALMGDGLHLPAWLIGLVYAAGGVGGLLGSMCTGKIIARIGMGKSLGAVFVWAIPFQLLIPLADHGWWIVCAMVGQLGVWASLAIRNIAQLSLRQKITPDALLTRVNASARFLSWGGLPLGALTAGLASEFFGTRATLWTAAGGLTLTAVLLGFAIARASQPLPNIHPDPAEPHSHPGN
ncbi:MFS transporter [Streptomyces werraensis]|uniref:MFS transporter n=1 Tax=Streptomyces werraensis TaxID=68284 RepID=UPI0037FBE0EC